MKSSSQSNKGWKFNITDHMSVKTEHLMGFGWELEYAHELVWVIACLTRRDLPKQFPIPTIRTHSPGKSSGIRNVMVSIQVMLNSQNVKLPFLIEL